MLLGIVIQLNTRDTRVTKVILGYLLLLVAAVQVVEAQQFGKEAIDVIFAEAEKMEKITPGRGWGGGVFLQQPLTRL